MLLRVIALAVGRVGKPHRRRRRVARRTIVPHVGPQAAPSWSCRCPEPAPAPACRRRAACSAQHIAPDRFHQRRQHAARAADPIGQRRAVQIDAFPLVDLRLPVQRQVIGILRHQHMRQQPRSGQATIDRAARRRLLHDAVAAAAAQLRPHLADHLEVRRHVLEHLGDVFAELPQRAAAIGAGFLLRRDGSDFARQVLGQRPPRRLALALPLPAAADSPAAAYSRRAWLPDLPAATPAARSAGRASPTSGQTASASA